jgi:hypothetical protein
MPCYLFPTEESKGKQIIVELTESESNLWFAPIKVFKRTYPFLVDTGASRSENDWYTFNALQGILPKVSPTSTQFTAANGSELKCHGIAHVPLTFDSSGEEFTKTLPIYICDLGRHSQCILGIDAAIELGFLFDCEKGVLQFKNGNHLNCSAGSPARHRSYQARVMESVIIQPHSFSCLPVDTRQNQVPPEWRHNVLCERSDDLWEDYGLTIVEGTVDFTKGPRTLCVINPSDEEIIVRTGQVVASLSPMDRAVVTRSLSNSSPASGEP